jgi:hypothetical protein
VGSALTEAENWDLLVDCTSRDGRKMLDAGVHLSDKRTLLKKTHRPFQTQYKIFYPNPLLLNKWWRNNRFYYTPTHRVGAILQSPCPSVRSHFRNRYLGFYWKKWFYIWYMALAWWLVPCLPFPGLPHIYFLFTVQLRIFHVCRNENFRNSYLSFYWKK